MKEIIKIRSEIAKINKTKSWFFEKINKIDKPLARLIKKKKREKTHINRIRNEKGEVITNTPRNKNDHEITMNNYIQIKWTI